MILYKKLIEKVRKEGVLDLTEMRKENPIGLHAFQHGCLLLLISYKEMLAKEGIENVIIRGCEQID